MQWTGSIPSQDKEKVDSLRETKVKHVKHLAQNSIIALSKLLKYTTIPGQEIYVLPRIIGNYNNISKLSIDILIAGLADIDQMLSSIGYVGEDEETHPRQCVKTLIELIAELITERIIYDNSDTKVMKHEKK